MVILPYYYWHMGNISFHFQFPLNLTSTNAKVENMLKTNDIWKKSKKNVKLLFLLNSRNSKTEASTIMKIGMYKGFIFRTRNVLLHFLILTAPPCVGYDAAWPFPSCVVQFRLSEVPGPPEGMS